MRVNALSLGLLIGCVASTALSDERKANSEITDADRAFWSFRPIEETPVPDGSQHPIDAFIRDRLEGDTLQASPKADKRTLMRRVFADGTGMPPAPDESARFMDDPAEDAYEQLVDRVLASPHFGERWARHWLDVARFAESGGFELDGDRPLAYQYRDFVIKAFNDDLPYNQFVQWQIAGD